LVSVIRARRFAAVGVGVLALALVCSSASRAATRTTQPGKTVLVYFVITDKNVAYEILRPTVGGNSDMYLEKYTYRGDFAKFTVINRGKKPRGFAFLGKKFALIQPGHRERFNRALLVRGAFPYRSTPGGKAFRGVFHVY
jgi:hypothetical protein